MTAKPEPLSTEEESIIRALGRAIVVLPKLLDADLVMARQLRLSEYAALMHLSEAPDRQLRMNQLATAIDVSMSGLTSIINRLEAQGLVERVKCPSDGRGSAAVLTPAGLDRLKEAYVTHLASVRQHVISHIPTEDIPQLAHALSALATSLGGARAPGGACPTGNPNGYPVSRSLPTR